MPLPEIVVGEAVLTSVNAGFWVACTVAPAESVTAEPAGGVPTTLAVSRMLPLSRSAWVVAYVTTQEKEAPAARVAGWAIHVLDDGVPAGAARTSEAETPVSVTEPVLVTFSVYDVTSPTADTVFAEGVLVIEIPAATIGVVTLEDAEVILVAPEGGVPDAVAVFTTLPAVPSAVVTV